jgi:hypothetical protein
VFFEPAARKLLTGEEGKMKNGKDGLVREIMMGNPVTLKPADTLDLANDIISVMFRLWKKADWSDF